MVIMEVLTVDSASLRALLDRDVPDCLVLDCRSFLSFNSSHISGSSNVRFSTIVRRRARGGLGLEHIVPNEDTRNRLLSGDYKSVVLLDDRSLDLGQVKKDGTLMLAVTALCRDPCGANVYILKGKKRALKYFDTYDLLLTRGRQMWATAVTIPAGAKVKKAPQEGSCYPLYRNDLKYSCNLTCFHVFFKVDLMPFLRSTQTCVPSLLLHKDLAYLWAPETQTVQATVHAIHLYMTRFVFYFELFCSCSSHFFFLTFC